MIGTEVDSRVSAVTVYRDRALITREVKMSLKKGEHSLVFPGLPANLDRNSIQVKSSADVILGGCMFETEFLTNDVNEQAAILLKKQQYLADTLAELELKLKRLDGEKAFVEKIASYVTTPQHIESDSSKAISSSPDYLNVSTWEGLTGFYRDRHSSVDSEKLEIAQKKRNIDNKIKKLASELKNLGHRKTRSRDIVRVNIEKLTEGEVLFNLSYAVPGPTWKPVYNLRFSSDSDKLIFEYDAMVSQSTGEDWNDIQLKLSTAQINLSGTLPELDPWRINFFQPPVPRLMNAKSVKRKSAKPMDDEWVGESAMAAPGFSEPPTEPMIKEASVEGAGASVLFKIAGATGITGDNSETQVGISRLEFPAEYLYRSVPKMSQFAYRIAKFTNDSLFPILPGKANIYSDSSLISKSIFELIMPEQESDVSLGVDEGIKVEYRFIKEFKKNEGLINKKISTQYEYCINLENNTTKKAKLEIFDQFPISQNKEIEVKPLNPETDKNNKDIKIDDESQITWFLNLAPAEKKELPLTYLVEYPTDRLLSGI